jgi:hypothetical protein
VRGRAVKSAVGSAADRTPVRRPLTFVTVIVLAALSLALLAASQGVARPAIPATGFAEPYAGTPRYEKYAPTEATSSRQVNRPLGQRAADRIARKLGLDKRRVFTAEQYRLFIRGQGHGGKPRKSALIDRSVRILTNTTGNPLHAKVNGKVTPIVLGSYGLMVNPSGLLESPANTDAATRKVNKLLRPHGYMEKWCRRNGAEAALRRLYRSAYTSEVIFGHRSQQQSGVAQLVPNQKGRTGTIVGMSMAPSLWIVNFSLIYTLNPSLAAKMPARWTPIPANVALAIAQSSTGQVPFSQYESSFPG